jgi:LacI family transcriptional regulator
MPVTMRDVAARAGVSIKTVSRVINNQPEILDGTRQRVQAVIDELGYRPNAVARSLVSGRSHSIAIIVPDITGPFSPEFVFGVDNTARAEGYSVFLASTRGDPEEEVEQIERLAAKQVDGFILYGTRLPAEQLRILSTHHRMSIVASRKIPEVALIRLRSYEGLQEITTHLIRLGHRAIGHVGWSAGEDRERVDGYRAALMATGIEVDPRWIVLSSQRSVEAGHLSAHKLLQQAPEITAITCFNDAHALGVMQACEELGRRIPQDLALVGFDDTPFATLVKPKLTTMRVLSVELGQMAMQQLLRVMAADKPYHEHLEVGATLVIRESCGAQNATAPIGINSSL